MGMAAPLYYTAEMVRALPEDGNTYEVVRGELLVTPAPRPWHEEICARLLESLRVYLRIEPFGHAFGSRSDTSWRSDTLVQPDAFVVPLYWIVDPDERQVEVWTPADTLPALERLKPTWHPAGAVDPFTLELRELFRAI